MRTPSVKTLRIIFGDNAKEAKRMLTCNTADIHTQAAENLRRECYHKPTRLMIRMAALNELGELPGVEAAESANGEFAEYLNTGDTYAPTLIYWRGNYRVQSVGDFIETMERCGIRFK